MEKILIIKLGALGDVVRTLPIAEALHKKFPSSQITWVTKPNAVEIFNNNPFIKKVQSIPFQSSEEFTKLFNFDIENEATELAIKIKAKEKFGFYSDSNFPMAFNTGSEYYINTIFDDQLKKANKKTMQEMMFDVAELKYEKILPKIYLTQKEVLTGKEFISKNNIKSKIIGIHIGGGGERWPSKEWHLDKIVELIKELKKHNLEILVFGGPNEIKKIEIVKDKLKKDNIKILTNNPHNTIREFCLLINICDNVVTMDSFSMHIATALNKEVVSLFFCTPSVEVESYGLIKKITSPLLFDFFPERMDQYDETLVNSIKVKQVLDALGV